jgi:septal ring factor EnvC (AmiA/AmiB activator)
VIDPSRNTYSGAALLPRGYQDAADVAECALDEQLEHLQRQYAAASRAVSRAWIDLQALQGRDDIHPHILAQLQRQHAAAEIRSEQLFQAIDALEHRLERREEYD